MKDDKLIKGMSRFSLQNPATRFDTEEWLFLENLRSEDCMAVRYDFVNLVLNGKHMGIYAIEEHFSKELIEANKRREGVIVKFNDYHVWRKHQPDFVENIAWQSFYRSSSPEFRGGKRVSSNPDFLKQAENAVNLLRAMQDESIKASQIFDIEKLSKFLAITFIWQANHGLGVDDINFYYNPVTSLLEPVGFDAEPTLNPHYCLFTGGWMKDTWVHFCLEDPLIASSYLKYVELFTDEKYINQFKNRVNPYESNIRRLILRELLWSDPITIWDNARKIFEYDPWDILQKRIARIKNELSEKRPLYAHCMFNDINKSRLKVTIRNCTTYPVEILSFSLNNQKLNPLELIESDYQHICPSSGNIYLPPQKEGILHVQDDLNFELDSKIINIDSTNAENYLIVESKFLGTESSERKSSFSIIKTAFEVSNIPLGSTNLELQGLPYKIDQKTNTISIEPGRHKVSGNIYIPATHGLILHPNTIIEFSSYSTFVCQSNIIARGTIDKPIQFTSENENFLWPGFLLYSTNNKDSIFDHVIFKHVKGVGTGPNKNGVTRNGWTMTGGITIYNCTAHFTNCLFENFQTEDALNIIASKFSLQNTFFKKVDSDAFDGDFVEGVISNCVFSDILGDGADFSGSDVEIIDCQFINISDKAISIGENSRAKVSKASIENVSFGVVSKDQSVTKVKDKTIVKNAKMAAFSAFQKKASFGPATISVFDSTTQSCNQDFLIQSKSSGLINGEDVPSSEFDVSKLYN